eukprot:11026572-Prorocentrum_lima.AAC.1
MEKLQQGRLICVEVMQLAVQFGCRRCLVLRLLLEGSRRSLELISSEDEFTPGCANSFQTSRRRPGRLVLSD